MTERISIRLYNPQRAHADMAEAWKWVRAMLIAGHRLVLEVRRETRSDAQNSLMWSCLSDIAKQVDWHGRKLSADDWKDMATAALKRQRVVPGIDGGFVVLGQRTSRMTKAELSELVDFLHALGDQRGVVWSRTSLGRDWPEEVEA